MYGSGDASKQKQRSLHTKLIIGALSGCGAVTVSLHNGGGKGHFEVFDLCEWGYSKRICKYHLQKANLCTPIIE